VAYITDNELKAFLKAHLKSSATLPTYWDTLVSIANTAAYNTILEKLLGRGYEQSDIDAWDRRQEFNYDLAMCRLLRHAASGNTPENWQQQFCRAGELDTIDLLVDGEIVDPVADEGEIGYGESAVHDTDWPWEADSDA